MLIDRLATVELQLVMQHCDLQTLLRLARCSRRTFAAASHDFAWRSLSPLRFDFSFTANPTLGAKLRGSRLLSHCDVSLRWTSNVSFHPGMIQATQGELAAIESVPRLVALDTRGKYLQSRDQMQRLLLHPALGGLTALHADADHLDAACVAQLPAHQPCLRSLTLQPPPPTFGLTDMDHRALLAPLSLLHSLTVLSLVRFNINAECAASIAACASLRRLHISDLPLESLSRMLTAPTCAQLESLALDDVCDSMFDPAGEPAAVAMWTAIFVSQRALQSLRLRSHMGTRTALRGAAVALPTGNALRSLTALDIDTLHMYNEDGSLLPLLAAHVPQLRQLRIEYSDRTLAGLPLLVGLRDLRLHQIQSGPHLHVVQCAALRRLHLSDTLPSTLHAILCAPQLQRLEALTLQSPRLARADDDDSDDDNFDDSDDDEDTEDDGEPLDWSLCLSNLHVLRTLHLLNFECGVDLLGAIPAAPPSSSLRRIRLDYPPMTVQISVQTMAAALRHLPSLTLETPKSSFGREWAELCSLHPDRTLTLPAPPSPFHADPFSFWSD